MSVIDQLAYSKGRRDEVPNVELAKKLAAQGDRKGIKEIAENLWNKDKNIQADCIKVLYEVGYIKPELIGDYVPDFLKLLDSRNNRLVWGGMTALSEVALVRPKEVYAGRPKIFAAIESGSVITVDNGIKVLARIASAGSEYNKKLFPYLLDHLKKCRPKEVAQHAESTLIAVNAKNKKQFAAVLTERQRSLSPSQSSRIKKIGKQLEKI